MTAALHQGRQHRQPCTGMTTIWSYHIGSRVIGWFCFGEFDYGLHSMGSQGSARSVEGRRCLVGRYQTSHIVMSSPITSYCTDVIVEPSALFVQFRLLCNTYEDLVTIIPATLPAQERSMSLSLVAHRIPGIPLVAQQIPRDGDGWHISASQGWLK